MLDKCPGAANILRPTIKIKICPECGEEVEILSSEVKTKCSKCGFTVYNDVASCVQWCEYAKECVGEEMYNRLMGNELAQQHSKGGKHDKQDKDKKGNSQDR